MKVISQSHCPSRLAVLAKAVIEHDWCVQIINQGNCRFSKLAGPLGAQEKGWYPDMPFLLSCMVAVDVFGRFVRQEKHLDVLAKLPTLIVQTEIDDSADHTVGVTVIKEIEDRTGILSLILTTLSPS